MKKIFTLIFFVSFAFSCSSGDEELPPQPIKYTLTTAANPTEGGTITPASGQYSEGVNVKITATPSQQYMFSSWSGATGSSNTTNVVMNSNKLVTANFVKKIPFYLDENGVTIKAHNWVTAGTTGELNGITYTAVDNTTLQGMIDRNEDVSKVVTSLVTAVNFREKNEFNLDIGSWDVSKITNMKQMFYEASDFNQDIGNWDVSNVTNMEEMFYRASDFNQDIGSWDVSNVTDMKKMFYWTGSFNKNIGNWDVSNVTNMEEMFSYSYEFNQDIGNWDVSNVTNMEGMFRKARSFNQDISNWNISKLTSMFALFFRATDFNQDISNWDVSNITNMSSMFYGATSFNQDIGDWDVSNVTDMSAMFMNDRSNVKYTAFNQDIGGWDVSNVTDMNNMFNAADAFNQDIGRWDVSNVTNMNQMFRNAEIFNQNLSGWCVSNISDEPFAFSESSSLVEDNKPLWGTCPQNSYEISVTASSNSDYSLSGKDRNGDVSGNDPDLTFKVGDEVTFSVDAANHPFYLKTEAGTGTSNQISGVTNNGTTSGNVVWTPSEAGTYYYQCSSHSGMVGIITIEE